MLAHTQTTHTSVQQNSLPPISIMLIDPSRSWLDAFPLALHRMGYFQVVSRATSISEGVHSLQTTHPDLVIIEGQTYLQGFRELGELLPIRMKETRVAIFAHTLTDAQLQIAVANRVQGYLSNADTTDDIAKSLEQLLSTGVTVSTAFADRILKNRAGQLFVARRSSLEGLTNRQLEVLTHLASGLRVKEIAELLNVSIKSVESHKFRIMNRLNIRDRVQLCRWAIREGLIAA